MSVACTRPVALISGGYGVSHYAYSFIAQALTARGFLVVSVQHDLPGDAPIPRDGNLYELRAPFWARGAENLALVARQLEQKFPTFNWARPVLIGHSNGGDISLWYAREHAAATSAVITLDHRRMPIARVSQATVLSLRGTDFPADAGVLPTTAEQQQFGIEVTTIQGAKHDEMQDSGPEEVKRAITERIIAFLSRPGFTTMRSP